MRGTDLKNDWDSFEELHVAVEQLELCQRLLRSRSHSKARAAVILLDHVADALMYRVCSYDFGHEEFLEMVIPPVVPKEKREKILYRFEKKLSYTAQIKKLISADASTVLTIAHRVRNFAYHRNYHNPSTIGIVGRILFKTVCGILPNFLKHGDRSYSSRMSQQTWIRKYGVTPSYSNFDEVLETVAEHLANRIELTIRGAAKIMKSDLSARFRRMQRTLKRWLSLKTDRQINEMLRRYEFADVYKDDLYDLLAPLKKARYVVHDLHKGVPPEDWIKMPIPPETRRAVRRGMIIEERAFKNKRRRLFKSFRQTVTASSLRAVGKDIRSLPRATSLGQLLSKYDSIERRLTQAESYASRAEADLDFAIDLARGK